MPVSQTTLTGPIYMPNGATPVGGKVSFELSSWDREVGEALIISGPVYSDIDENGQFSVELFTTTEGVNTVNYKMYVLWEDSELSQSYVNNVYVSSPAPHYTKKYIGSFALAGAGPFQVSDLNIVSELESNSFDVMLECQAYAVAAALSAEVVTDAAAAVNFATNLIQEKVNGLFLGAEGSPIFTNAQNAAQGVAFARVGAQRKAFLLQRVDSSGGDWSATEQHRIVEYNLTDDGTEISPVTYSVPLSLGHQMISARVEGGQVYIYGSTPVAAPFTGVNAGKGVVKFPWNGVATNQADFVHYQLLGLAGSGHRFESYKKSHTFVDDDYIMLVTNDTTNDPAIEGDLETGDSHVIIWNRAEVESAADPLEVEPVAAWQRIKPRQIQNHYTQGAVISNGHVWVQCGYYAPLQQQMIQIWTLNGELVREFSMDGARGDYDFDQLRGVGALGIPASFEPEGLTVDDDGNVIALHMANFRAAGSVVSRGSKTYAAYRTTTAGIPCTNLLYWTPVNLTPSGAWDAATAYAPGAYIQRKKVLHVIKPPAGGAREKPLNTGRTLADSSAFLQLPNAAIDLTWPWGEALSFGTFALTAGETLEQVSFRGGNTIRLRDTNEGADLEAYFQIKHLTYSGGIARNFTEIRADQGAIASGAGMNLYGSDDPINPNLLRLFAGATVELALSETDLISNVPIKAPGLSQTVHSSGVRSAVTGTTTETVLASATVPGGMMGPNGYLLLRVQAGQTNNANSKTLRVKIGGQNVVASANAYSGSSGTMRIGYWQNRGVENSQVIQGAAAESGSAETSVAVTTTTVNTAADFVVQVTGELAVGTDELALESWAIEVVYMP